MNKIIIFIFLLFLANKIQAEDCSNFNGEFGCSGQQTVPPDDWANRNFQTPPKESDLYKDSYQFYNELVGYAQIKYNSEKTIATINFYTRVNNQKHPENSYSLLYIFNGVEQTKSNYLAHKEDFNNKTLSLSAYIIVDRQKVASLELDPIDFVWNNIPIQLPGNYKNGQKGAIVDLFGWPYTDIEQECEHLGKAGYLGVKIMPPHEAMLNNAQVEENQLNPWYLVYQPVSYRLHSRMGSRSQLKSMIDTCRKHKVRVYADAVNNHMVGCGNDMFPSHRNGNGGGCTYWANKNSSGGSPFYTMCFSYQNWTYTGTRPGQEFPGVPFGPMDFHCSRSLSSWTDGFVLNYGWLVGLTDLRTESPYVQQRIADYWTDLLSIGISGIRVDAAKHIKPQDLAEIFARLKNNMGGALPEDFFAFLEVIMGGEKDLLFCQEGWYNFYKSFDEQMRKAGLSESDIQKILIWSSDYPKEFPACGRWILPAERFAIQNDDHDQQFGGSSSRDMQGAGSVLVKSKDVNQHKYFEKLLFSRTDGNWNIKLILSSYTLNDQTSAFGIPDGLSDCANCTTPKCKQECTRNVKYQKAHDPNACGYTVYDQSGAWSKENIYTRTHRDYQIILAMRQWMGLSINASPAEFGLPSNCGSKSDIEEVLDFAREQANKSNRQQAQQE